MVDTTKTNHKLSITAIDRHGHPVVTVRVQPMCGAFVTSHLPDRDLLITTDTDLKVGTLNDGTARFFVTAWDLHSGRKDWGPVDVPGPHKGPGRIFGVFDHSAVADPDRRDPTAAIRPTDGTVSHRSDPGTLLLQEHNGILLLGDRRGHLRAVDTTSRRTRWSSGSLAVPRSASSAATAPRIDVLASVGATSDVALLAWRVGDGDHGLRYAAYRLSTGQMLADLGDESGVQPLPDATGTAVALAGAKHIVVAFPGGKHNTIDLARLAGTHPVSLIGHTLYTRADGHHSMAVDAATGHILATGTWQPPTAALPTGTALVAPDPDNPGYLAYRTTAPIK
ncbi:hypothetical protein [Actinocatenispora comari]|uniref:Uncharacterized protein n=1 Tax=Actinocatenispora comari TaxID=2807577 RepID=A0A8J4AAQ8_9ACTN|nr:hypothetical protein [Actinocatenispora comari]GIL25323.1 hypothetical protein NUM_05780 [Actinocatenispora comari]